MKEEKPILDGNGEPLKILLIAAHHCIRVVRQGMALINKDYTVWGAGNKQSFGNAIYKNYFLWHDERQFKNCIKTAIDAGIKIIHYNNEPDRPAIWCREVINEMEKQNEVKLIFDWHDVDSIRKSIIPLDEREAVNASDAFVYVSESIKNITNKLHSITKPSMVLYNYPTQSMYNHVDQHLDWNKVYDRKHLVYEGGINPIGNDPHAVELNKVWRYRNLYPLFMKLIDMGNEVHAFVGNGDALESGMTTGVVIHPPTVFDQMLIEIMKYRYNLLIFNTEEDGSQCRQTELTTPNKMWDALCSGLPSLACYCNETEKYLEKHKIGLTFKSLEDIGDTSSFDDKYEELIENIKQKRKELVFENQIIKSENLYAYLLGFEQKHTNKENRKNLIFEYGVDEFIKTKI